MEREQCELLNSEVLKIMKQAQEDYFAELRQEFAQLRGV